MFQPARLAERGLVERQRGDLGAARIWFEAAIKRDPEFAMAYVDRAMLFIDANQPRYHVGDLAGQSLRAYGAHLNGLETFPWFASAVIVSHIVGGPSVVANVLAVVYILLRIGHMAAYITGRQPLRSAAFTVAQFVALALMTPGSRRRR